MFRTTSTPHRPFRLIAVMFVAFMVVSAEERFNRPVIKLADAKAYKFFKIDDVRFPVSKQGTFAVSCLTYRGTKRYYVEVGVTNFSDAPVTLTPGFTTFNKPGYSVFLMSTIETASEVWASVAGSFECRGIICAVTTATTYSLFYNLLWHRNFGR